MRRLDINTFSKNYVVKRLREKDVNEVFAFCRENTFYYECCGRNVEIENILSDMTIFPPGKELKDKYYVGFYEDDQLVALMDLIDGYPSKDTIYIGFFMTNANLQGRGIGSIIIEQLCVMLMHNGISRIELAYDKDNPQSKHFWNKNGFKSIREVEQKSGDLSGILVVANKQLILNTNMNKYKKEVKNEKEM